MTDITALIIALTCLYSTRHWIGATMLLIFLLVILYQHIDDPLGTKAAFRMLRGYGQ